MEILRCSHLTKTYKTGSNQVVALDNVDLALEKGSFTAIVGASGSGKSTLLHLLGGVDRPTSGNIYIEDTDISHPECPEKYPSSHTPGRTETGRGPF